MNLIHFHSAPHHFHSAPRSRHHRPKEYVRSLENRQQDRPYSDVRATLLADAAEVAGLMYDALNFHGGGMDFNEVRNLCREHGCEPLIVPCLPRRYGGYFIDMDKDITEFSDGGQILLSAHMTFAQSCAVMVHELAHRLLYSPRFADWLDAERTVRRYDPHQWQEAVARAVERLFLEAGGTGLIPPRY